MAVSQINEGHGATVAFGSGGDNAGLALVVTSIDLPGEEVDEIDTSHLGTGTHRTKIGGALRQWSDVTLNVITKSDELPTVGNTGDTVTITAPVQDGESSAYSLSFSCFVKSASRGTLATHARAEASVVLTITGDVTETPST